ncbi:thioesterase II family protein [Streptomyces turgidiscabies]|uniref:Medium-chain acyl-[acyl-carrier-protein] hydrolase n=1 Tax=Streptomyces turgidiscabies TaxID=85558 RepID=A0ABU0RYN5_9ACTN|nr:thioesterase domain-containing protein [Streptomyces turgidiscabies]MDQ0937106.1 medium-chain acyl-[acyl-carrier-protein] hydrolase [Streptomyces turgidiscabies]
MTDPGDWVLHSGAARDVCHSRLMCFPQAGGGTLAYRPWTTLLAPDVDILPVVLPGRDARYREPPFTDLAQLARAAAEGLRPILFDQEPPVPYAFFGHSLGALLAYETARVLSETHPPPALLIVSGSAPPHRAAAAAPTCHTLPDEEFLTEVVRLGGVPHAALDEPELIRVMLPVLRADFTAAETYVHAGGTPLDCPVAVYTGDTDSSVPRAQLTEWDQVTHVRPVRHRVFAGDHFYLDDARRPLLRALRDDLQEAAETGRAMRR